MISHTVEDLGQDLKVMEREKDPARKPRTTQAMIRTILATTMTKTVMEETVEVTTMRRKLQRKKLKGLMATTKRTTTWMQLHQSLLLLLLNPQVIGCLMIN
jgi:hypothetical protein